MRLPRNASAKHFWKKPSFSHYWWGVLQMPQPTPLTAGCSVITQQGSLWSVIPTRDIQCRKKARNGPVSTALLGKKGWGLYRLEGSCMVEGNTHLQHWKRKCRQKGQDAHLDFMCLETKIRADCCATTPPRCTLRTRWTGKVNSKHLPCLDCKLQSMFIGVSTTDKRDRSLFCYRKSQICPISESGATTPLNSRYPKPDSFSEAKQSWRKWLLHMQSRKWKERKKKNNDVAQPHKGENRHFWKPFPTFHLLHWFTPLGTELWIHTLEMLLRCICSTHYKHPHSQNRDEIGAIIWVFQEKTNYLTCGSKKENQTKDTSRNAVPFSPRFGISGQSL